MARPTPTTPYQEQLYAELAPLAYGDAAAGWPLLKYCGAIASMFDQIDTYVTDRDDMPGWAILFDPDLCPPEALPWLANCGGVTFTVGMSVAEQRVAIKSLGGRKRGGVDSIAAAAAQYLSGSKSVYIRESDVPFKTQMQTFNYDGTDAGIPQLDAAGGGGNATISTEEGCLRVNMGASAGLATVFSQTGQFSGGPQLILPNQSGTQYNAPCISVLLRMRSVLGTANVTASIRVYDASFNYLGSQDLTTQQVLPHGNFQNFVYPITGALTGFFPTAYYFVPSFKCSDAGVQFYVDQMSTRYGTFSQVIFGGSDPYFVSVSVKKSELPEVDRDASQSINDPNVMNNAFGWNYVNGSFFNKAFPLATQPAGIPEPGLTTGFQYGNPSATASSWVSPSAGFAGGTATPANLIASGCRRILAGQTYKYRFWVSNYQPGNFSVHTYFWRSDGTWEGDHTVSAVALPTTGAWVLVTGTWTAPMDGYVCSALRNDQVGSSFNTVYTGWTDSVVESLTDYGGLLLSSESGDSPNWTWSGTPRASKSVRTPQGLVEAAVRAQKPAGIILTFYTLTQPSYQSIKNIVPDYGALAGGGGWVTPFTYAGLAAQTY